MVGLAGLWEQLALHRVLSPIPKLLDVREEEDVALGALMLSPDLEALLGTPSACLGGILSLPAPPGAFPRLQFHIRL